MDCGKWQDVEDEQERTEHRTFRDSLWLGSNGGGAAVDADEPLSVGEIGSEPGECRASDVVVFMSGEENWVLDGVEGCEVEHDEDGEAARVWGEEKVIGDCEEGCFSAVLWAESRLKWFELVVWG